MLLNPEESGLFKPFKLQAQQIGCLNQDLMQLVDAALKLHLGLA
jgi:hypothetical protein